MMLRKHLKLTAALVICVPFILPALVRAEAGKGIDPFIKMRWPERANLAPDETLYFVYNPDGINQLYKVAPGKTQKDAVKLTSFKDGIGGYNLSEDGKWVAITAAIGGSEQFSLYLLNTATDKVEDLLVDPKVVYANPVWRRDSKAFAYRANDESPADFHVYIMDLETRKPKKAYAAKGHHDAEDWSRDGSKLVVSKFLSASHSQLFEINVATGESREITPRDEQWTFEAVGYSADEKHFLVNTNYRGDLTSLHSIDLSTGKIEPILSDLAGKEIDGAGFNFERTTLAVMVNEDGYSTLHLRNGKDHSPLKTPNLAKGLVGNIRFRGPHMLYSLDNANTPGIIYKWDMTKPEQPGVALTQADTQGIDVSKFRLPELVQYTSFDGMKIPAFMYLPADYKKGTKIPFIVQYHGGPESQFRPSFTRVFQYFVSQGYGVLAPNPRGSSGYGKAFVEADNYKNRDKSVKDGIWAAKYLIEQGYTEQKKIAAWGGSYGGFMTMAVITEAPELWGAACNVVGVVNFETFLEQTKDYRRALREAEYGPLTDREFLKSVSPIHKIDRITCPLMLAHGLNDPRVPVGEAMQIAVAMKKRGIDVEELYFPDEGHGFAKEDNRLLYYQELGKFFDAHLKKTTTPAPSPSQG